MSGTSGAEGGSAEAQSALPDQAPSVEAGPQSSSQGGKKSAFVWSETSSVLKLKGLPYSTTEDQIREFFHAYNLREVSFVFEPDGRPSGLAFAEFDSKDEAMKALARNGDFLGQRYVRLLHVPSSEMEEQVRLGTLAIPGTAAKMWSQRMQQRSSNREQPVMYNAPAVVPPGMVPRMMPGGPMYAAQRGMEIPWHSYPRMPVGSAPGNLAVQFHNMSMGPSSGFPNVYPSHQGMSMHQRPLQHSHLPAPPGASPMQQQQHFESLLRPPSAQILYSAVGHPNQQARPPSVGASSVTCKGYQYLPDSLQIGLDSLGRPSGEAWLSFLSPEEALRAVRDLNRQYLGGRYLELSLC